MPVPILILLMAFLIIGWVILGILAVLATIVVVAAIFLVWAVVGALLVNWSRERYGDNSWQAIAMASAYITGTVIVLVMA